MKVKCPYCGYEWDYKGKLLWATCPSCMRRFEVEKNKIGGGETDANAK